MPCFLILFLFSAGEAVACFSPQTVNWTGNVNSDWNNSANYDATPGNNDRIVVDPANYTGAAVDPVIASASSFQPNKVEVYNGGILTVSANLSLKQYIFTESQFLLDGSGSNATVNSGTLDINYYSSKRDIIVQNGSSLTGNGGSVNARNLNVLTSSQADLAGSNVTLDADLSLSGLLNFSSGTLKLAGNYANNGTYNHTGGTIEFNGSGAQTIDGASTFFNMSVNNSGGSVTLNTGLHDLLGTLSLNAGTFNTNNALTVVSNDTITGSIGTITGGTINGTVTMQRKLLTGPDGWRLLSSPISGMTLQDWNDDFITSGFTGSDYPSFPFYSIWSYDETKFGIYDTGFVHPGNITDPILTGKGYWCYIGPLPTVIDLAGNINSGAFNFNVTYTPNAGPANDGWNWIGNPYPSTIDWDSPNWTKTNIAGAIYIWNPANQQWASYVFPFGTNGGSNFIASSQGFCVQTTGASPSLILQETCKSTVDATFLKRNNNLANSFSLILSKNNKTDETVLRFDQNATSGFDTYFDAWKLFSSGNVPSISSVIQDSLDMSINSVPGLSVDYSIPLRVKTWVSGQHVITAHGIGNMPDNACIILEDTYNNILTDLRADSTYLFNLSDTTEYPRFLVHISAPGILETHSTTCDLSNGFAVGHASGSGPWVYTWKDSLGNIIQQDTSINSLDTLNGVSSGMFVLVIEGNSNYCNSTVVDTFYIGHVPLVNIDAMVQDVACYGDSNGQIELSITGGTPPYSVLWQDGDTTTLRTGLPPGLYIVEITDQALCYHTDSFTLGSPDQIVASFVPSSDTIYLIQGGSVDFINNSSGASSYFWDFGDGSYATDANPTHTYLNDGLFTVMLKALNGQCDDSVFKQIVVLTSPGITEETTNEEFSVYSKDNDIYILPDLLSTQITDISVVNALGQEIYKSSQPLFNQSFKLGINARCSGIYTVSLRSGKIHYVQRILLENR